MGHKKSAVAISTVASIGLHVLAAYAASAEPPAVTLRNGQLAAMIYLPDTERGYYRGTRFDWFGIVGSLRFQGRDFVTPWYQATDPQVLDYEMRGEQVVTGPSSTMVGFPEVFTTAPNPLGWDEAPVGGSFLKIGVGVLRKPDDKAYSQFRPYEIVDRGRQTVKHSARSITFTQALQAAQSGYAYLYTKKVSLTRGKAQMLIEHTLRNTGTRALHGRVYEHNFTRWDHAPPSPDYRFSFAYDPKFGELPANLPLSIEGRNFRFTRPLVDKETFRLVPTGFGPTAADYDFRVENTRLGIGLRMTADQALAQAVIWSVRTVFAIEPFIAFNVAPGAEFNWTLTYDAYALAP